MLQTRGLCQSASGDVRTAQLLASCCGVSFCICVVVGCHWSLSVQLQLCQQQGTCNGAGGVPGSAACGCSQQCTVRALCAAVVVCSCCSGSVARVVAVKQPASVCSSIRASSVLAQARGMWVSLSTLPLAAYDFRGNDGMTTAGQFAYWVL